MFSFFKRAPPPVERANKVCSSQRSGEGPSPPATVPQAVECSDDSAWQDWEDSSLALDSQMQPLEVSRTVRDRQEEVISQFDDLDPFSSVRKAKRK